MYYIYHVPGKKIGVTKNLERRVTKEQGYKEGEYVVLDQSVDISYISDQEIFYQKKFGYKTDFNSYKTINNQFKKGSKMAINITEQTVTFPVSKENLKAYLAKNSGFKFKIENTEVRLDEKVQTWIAKNARTSHFRQSRSYVYNKSLVSFIDELVVEHTFKAGQAKEKIVNASTSTTRFDDIRKWADERGIYAKGDAKTQLVKLVEEQGEVARAILKNDSPEIKDGIGDMVVVLTNLAHLSGFTIEECIEAAYNEIKDRKGNMDNGTFKKETL